MTVKQTAFILSGYGVSASPVSSNLTVSVTPSPHDHVYIGAPRATLPSPPSNLQISAYDIPFFKMMDLLPTVTSARSPDSAPAVSVCCDIVVSGAREADGCTVSAFVKSGVVVTIVAIVSVELSVGKYGLVVVYFADVSLSSGVPDAHDV